MRIITRGIDRIKNPTLRKLAWFAMLWLGSVLVVGIFAYTLRSLLKMTF